MMGQLLALNTNSSLCCAIGAFASAMLYGAGLTRLWRRAGAGRGVNFAQVTCFILGWCAAALPAITALHVLGRQVFVLHMLEHEILMAVAAPLLILARPLPVFLWGLPAPTRRALRAVSHSGPAQALWRWLTQPRNATALQGAALWAWHWPPLFQTALIDEPVHIAQHLSFLVTALLFWWSILAPRAGPIAAVFALFVTTVHSSLLGAWVTFSRGFWYSEPYLGAFCGLTRAQDQQLAGLIMWIPASLIYFAVALYLIGAMFKRYSKRGPYDHAGRVVDSESGSIVDAPS
jgi:cytochrome c oxidase assembly factor CtaG